MQFATSFIEYLVSGSGALIWLTLLLGMRPGDWTGIQTGGVVLLIPLVFLIGIFVDSLALLALTPLKPLARRAGPIRTLVRRAGSPPDAPAGAERGAETAFVILHSPDLGKELTARSSKDRIARGALVNVVLSGLAAIVAVEDLLRFFGEDPAGFHLLPTRILIALGTLALAFFTFLVWWGAERATSRFKREAVPVIEDKLRREGEDRPPAVPSAG